MYENTVKRQWKKRKLGTINLNFACLIKIQKKNFKRKKWIFHPTWFIFDSHKQKIKLTKENWKHLVHQNSLKSFPQKLFLGCRKSLTKEEGIENITCSQKVIYYRPKTFFSFCLFCCFIEGKITEKEAKLIN